MRFILASALAILSAGCATSLARDRSSAQVLFEYDLSIWARDQRNFRVGKSLSDVKLSNLPQSLVLQNLLKAANKPEVQIIAFCRLTLSGKLSNCERFQYSPDTLQVRLASAELISRLLVPRGTIQSTTPTPNYAVLDIRVAREDAKLGDSGGCILVPRCGMPLPPAPPRPQDRDRS